MRWRGFPRSRQGTPAFGSSRLRRGFVGVPRLGDYRGISLILGLGLGLGGGVHLRYRFSASLKCNYVTRAFPVQRNAVTYLLSFSFNLGLTRLIS